MKLSKKTAHQFELFFSLGIIAGTLLWELLAVIICHFSGIQLNLSIGPIGFDIRVLSVYICLNVGSIVGGICGLALFSRL